MYLLIYLHVTPCEISGDDDALVAGADGCNSLHI